MNFIFQKKVVLFFVLLLLFALLYFPVFTADFAYLDEIHQLWNNRDQSNLNMFLTQGRWLTGLVFQKFFSSLSTISELKLLRLFSLGGWVLTAFLLCLLFYKWRFLQQWQPQTLWLGALYTVCSLSVCIFIGWASCFEVFASIATGVLSGHILYSALRIQTPFRLFSPAPLLSLVLGVITLFIYQTGFGIFLLPFFLHFIKSKTPKPGRTLLVGVVFYLVTYVVYYFLFQYSLQVYGTVASNRTGISFDVLGKLSFFFSGPLPQAFSLNLPYYAGSIFSQVFYPLVLLVWVVCVFKNNRQNTVLQNATRLFLTLVLLALIYLPVMIAKENFASYRTLYAFNLAVFLMVVDGVFQLLKNSLSKKVAAVGLAVLLLLSCFYTFHYLYIIPLQQEYKALQAYMKTHYRPKVETVYFIRADKHLFAHLHGTNVYRDEFGLPSTYRDWVPEPIVKQLALEATGNRQLAEQLTVVQFENMEQWQQANPVQTPTTLLIDMNTIYKNALP